MTNSRTRGKEFQVGNWTSFTPTGSWTANTTYAGQYMIISGIMFGTMHIALSGTPTSATLSFNLPSGYQVDSSKYESTALAVTVGHGSCKSAGSFYLAIPRYIPGSETSLGVAVITTGSTYAQQAGITQALPGTFTNGDALTFQFQVAVTTV